MEQFPLADTNAGMTALMGLVTVVTTEILHGAVIGYGNFIDGKKTEALACVL